MSNWGRESQTGYPLDTGRTNFMRQMLKTERTSAFTAANIGNTRALGRLAPTLSPLPKPPTPCSMALDELAAHRRGQTRSRRIFGQLSNRPTTGGLSPFPAAAPHCSFSPSHTTTSLAFQAHNAQDSP